MPPSFDTVILGSGFAGIIAARTLAAQGRQVLVLEGRDRTGGRARSYDSHGKTPVDLGCSWAHGYNEGTPVKELMKELGIAAHVPKPADALTYGPSGLIDPALVQKLSANFGAAVGAAKNSAHSTTSDASLASSLLDSSSPLFTGLKEEEKPLAIGLARTMQVGLGATLENASLRWTGYEDNFDGTNAAPEGGYQAVTSALQAQAEKDGATFLLNQTIISVTLLPDSTIEVTTVSPSGESFKHVGRTVICTLPVGVLKHVPSTFFSPPLSARKQAAIERVNVGTLGKLALFYSTAWWPATASSITILPSTTTSSPDPTSALSLLLSTSLVIASFSSDSLPSPHPTLLIYLPTTITAAIEALPVADVAAAAHQLLLATIKPATPPEGPAHAAMTSWSADPFCKGATTTPVTIGDGRSPLDFVELGKPEKVGGWAARLGFAGEHTDVDHRGSVAGATISGEREGKRVAGLLGRME